METELGHQKHIRKWLNIPAIGMFVAICVVLIALSTFVKSVSDLINVLPKQENLIASFDVTTQEKSLAISKSIDYLFAELQENPDKKFSEIDGKYIQIEIELRNLLLRQTARPLNELSIKQTELLIESFSGFRELHKSHSPISLTAIELARNQFYIMFSSIVVAEGHKK
tara:strand:- start:5061 stop:5567 length:507 start_codon:yes stop_codon:yes gene_type:complete